MKKTRLKNLVSIAEIISSLAIVLSLFYAAYEFSRSKTLTNRDVENIIYQRMLEMDRLIIENPGLSHLFLKAADHPDSLSREEQMRFLAFEHIFYDSWESAWYYYHEDILDEETWTGWNTWFIAEAKRRPALGWHGNRKHFNGAFLEFIDGLQKQNPPRADMEEVK